MPKTKTKTLSNLTNSKFQLISNSDGFFDDCPVCLALKEASKEGRELSQEELEVAFAEANEQN